MLSYNGSIPGPFIKAPQGAEITINFTNETDIEQTIHSHGIRIDNNSDGVPYMTQDPVPPGGSFTYTIKFDDAGIFWYHPHTREDYNQEKGLYGNYIVEPSDPEYWSGVNREIPLVLDDILLDDDSIADFYKDFANYALLGRFGNKYLVNGEQDYTTNVAAGEVIRFFITNVSNVQTYNLSVPGARIKLVGADLGKFERETYESSLLISPAERLVVEVYFPEAGTYKLMHTDPDGETELARFFAPENSSVETSYTQEFNVPRANEAVIDEFAGMQSYKNAAPDKELLLTIDLGDAVIDHSAHMGHSQNPSTSAEPVDRLSKIQWSDPGQSDVVNTTDTILWQLIDQQTGKVNMDIDWRFKQGDLVKIRLVNDANADHVMQHPIHLHGQRFVILEENGIPNDNMAWKDTVLVFPGETLDILVEMSNLGEWMSHCHIAEHLESGMMLGFRVEDESGYATGDEYRATIPANLQHGNRTQTTPDTSQQSSADSNTERFTFNMSVPQSQLSVRPETTKFQANNQQQFTITVFDSQGNSVQPSSDVDRPVAVTFVKSDDSTKVYTYPGNNSFPEIDATVPSQNVPGAPGFDESQPHSHSFNFIPQALAHGGVDDGDGPESSGRIFSYTIPVVFPAEGLYRGFVEFVPLGTTEPVLLTFDVEVESASSNLKWILFLIILAVPVAWFVRKPFKASSV